jgi:hypothetical protein
MKSILIVIFSVIFTIKSNAQLLDIELNRYSNLICDSLKLFEAVDSTRSCAEINELIYSRRIKLNISVVKYYEIGLTVSHGYKYIGILRGTHFKLLRSKDFLKEYSEIINSLQIDNTKVYLSKMCNFLMEIKGVYDYNLNPPWRR